MVFEVHAVTLVTSVIIPGAIAVVSGLLVNAWITCRMDRRKREAEQARQEEDRVRQEQHAASMANAIEDLPTLYRGTYATYHDFLSPTPPTERDLQVRMLYGLVRMGMPNARMVVPRRKVVLSPSDSDPNIYQNGL